MRAVNGESPQIKLGNVMLLLDTLLAKGRRSRPFYANPSRKALIAPRLDSAGLRSGQRPGRRKPKFEAPRRYRTAMRVTPL